MTPLLLWLACTRTPPAILSSSPEPAREPAVGWYDGACYSSLDGDIDVALAYLERSIEAGSAPLVWMGEDPDLVAVRADPRYAAMRDAAIDRWIARDPPSSALDWLAVAEARQVQEHDPTSAFVAAEAAGVVYPVLGPDWPPVTPALRELPSRRAAWIATQRGTVTVETPRAFELATIVLSQTAYGQDPNATDRSTAYSREVDAWFGPHRDHPLIRELDALPVDMNVYYAFRNQSAAWDLRNGELVPSTVYPVGGFWGGDDPFAARVDALEDFVAVTDAEAFLDAHAEVYSRRIEAYEAAVPIRAMWDWLEARFPAEGDGRDALVVRTSPLIGGSHNASTLAVDGFTQGTMVVPVVAHGDALSPVEVGPLARMVFTEIDHHYVNPVSDRMRAEIESAIGDHRRFNAQDGYGSAQLTFNEYATWVLFDVWWAEHCDAVGCAPDQRAAGAEDTVGVMERRGFHRYAAFRDAIAPTLANRPDVEAMFPVMLDWFRAQPR